MAQHDLGQFRDCKASNPRQTCDTRCQGEALGKTGFEQRFPSDQCAAQSAMFRSRAGGMQRAAAFRSRPHGALCHKQAKKMDQFRQKKGLK